MSKNKKLKVINQTKRKKLDRILASTLAGVLCAGALAGGGYYAYKQIKDRDKTIDDQKTTIGQLEEENEVSKAQIEQLTNDLSAKVAELLEKDKQIEAKDATIAEKDADIADKQKAIEEKDAEIAEKQKTIEAKDKTIAEKQATINEQTTSINTLTSQKTSLLSAVTEIDQKINSTSDSVEIDNLEARKTAILTQIDQLDSQIETLTSQKTKLENDVKTLQSDKTQLQNEIDTLTSDKTKLQNQVNTLTSEKTQLQQEVATLTTEKQNLQSQIDTLNSQLAEFEQYTLNIDQTNPVESITIEDTKLGTSATMSNVNITTLKLYSWQNATIKYASVEGSTVKATLNGTIQETDTVTIVGSSNKGASISIGSATQPIGKVAGLYKTGTDELTKSWSQLLADGDISFFDGGFSVSNKELEGDFVFERLTSPYALAYLNCAFRGCSKLALIDFSQLETSNVIDMIEMFEGCSGLTVLDLSYFETSKVTDVSYMFKNDSSLTSLDISNFDFSSVTDHDGMFEGVSTDCEILVKDEAAKTWLNTNFPTMTNVKIKTAEASA